MMTMTQAGVEVNSVIVGLYGADIYRITWMLKTNINWETELFELKITTKNKTSADIYEHDTKGNWTKNGNPATELNGCLYIDIALSPFTNTLPINHLEPAIGETQTIKTIYFDILEEETKPLSQLYERLSDTQYRYQNIPNNFEAIITVDEAGLVVDYPELFERLWKDEY